MTKELSYQICKRGVWDTTVPGITFDEKGISNYSKIHDKLDESYPRGETGLQKLEAIVHKIKKAGKKKKYDCIVGVSGGTDSSFLLHIVKRKFGLKPLAVNLDNGWHSDTAVKNIKKMTTKLNIDLETYVIDYEEMKDILRSYMKASLPWVDGPTDLAIKAILYKTASREGIKYILSGSDFRTEGKQPIEWTHTDARQFKYILKKFGNGKLKTFPYLTILELVYYGYVKKIKTVSPLYYWDYRKTTAQDFLKKEYGWEYYGGHHHENIFTKFIIGYWLPKKFNIDKRIITFSAQVLSEEITRDQALEELKKMPYNEEQMEKDKEYVIKKLDLDEKKFKDIFEGENNFFWDYPSYYPLLVRFQKIIKTMYRFLSPNQPKIFTEMEIRNPTLEKNRKKTKIGYKE